MELNGVNPEDRDPGDRDPVIGFVVNGIRMSLQQNQMTHEQAESLVKSWYPEAVIDIPNDPSQEAYWEYWRKVTDLYVDG